MDITPPMLKPAIWVAALLRRAQSAGAFATIIKKGDEDGGAVLLCVRARGGMCTLYRPVRNMEGARVWWPKGPMSEADMDPYLRARQETDPDIWIVEIEDNKGRHFITEPIETST